MRCDGGRLRYMFSVRSNFFALIRHAINIAFSILDFHGPIFGGVAPKDKRRFTARSNAMRFGNSYKRTE
jgi:hypothetical protein